MWIGMFNTISFLNAFIWSGDIFKAWDGKVFCDIEIKFIIAAMTGEMGSIAACARNLANIMRDDLPVVKTRAEKRRQLIIDLLFCFGVPVWMMSIHYVIQPGRYWLIEVIGCTPTVDNSWPSIVLVFIWPPISALAATYFCILVFIRLRRYQNEFDNILSNSTNKTTKSRFLRLYIYCSGLILFLLPTTFYTFYRELNVERLPYDWKLIHDPVMWADIYRIPTNGKVAFDKWMIIGAGLLLFLFFGFGQDANTMYKDWIVKAGLGKYWERMRKNKKEEARKRHFVNDWSGNTKKEKIITSGIMGLAELNSLGDDDDDPEISTIYIAECSGNWKQSGQKSPPSNSATPQTRLKSPGSPPPPLVNLDEITHMHTSNSLANDFEFQSTPAGNGAAQGDKMPRSCTMHEDGVEHHANEKPGGASSCQRQVGNLRKGKAKADGASTSESSSIMVETEVRVVCT
ncbi:pheromone A receptor-domain-containing protein [Terfezia claveryi]|nr:pheromone A receptor-domain-containing protein [Terfezia claveryi]